LSYDYSDDEVEEFMLAKFFKDCGYTYPEIKKEMDRYRKNKIEVLDEIISKMESKVE
jgi:phosphoribosylaminoimidazole-succinocarboxamide synthase